MLLLKSNSNCLIDLVSNLRIKKSQIHQKWKGRQQLMHLKMTNFLQTLPNVIPSPIVRQYEPKGYETYDDSWIVSI